MIEERQISATEEVAAPRDIQARCPTCGGTEFRPHRAGLPELRFGIPDRSAIYRCSACGLYATHPQPTQDQLDDLYRRHYVPRAYEPPDREVICAQVQGISLGDETLLNEWALESSTEVPALFYGPGTRQYFVGSRNVLDVGAHTGENMLWLECGGWRVTGIEANDAAAAIGRNMGLSIHTTRLEQNDLASESFDAVYMSYLIEHLLDPRAGIEEVRRLLRPGGRLLLTTHNVASIWRRVFGSSWINWHTPFHLWHFDTRNLTRMIEQNGFRVLYLTTRTPRWWLLFSLRATRDRLRRRAPHERLFEPMGNKVGARLGRLLRVGESIGQGDCTIAICEKID